MTALVNTKLYVPLMRAEFVPRPRLLERLTADLEYRKLTLVSAPAGFGKTTLVAAWVQSAGLPHGWLSLDEGDNDPARFFSYLLAALQAIDPGMGRGVEAMQRSPQPPPAEALLTTLVNDLSALPSPFVLVLDDYHLVHTLSIHQQLAFLLEHQPPTMHLVIVTREDPPLPLARLRASGQMVEIRQADLTFTEEETARFLWQAMHSPLSQEDVATLHRRTEGWITGLQLAALSLRGHEATAARRLIRSLGGTNRYILDYLVEEVFARQPTALRDFLLDTSILDRLTAPLCDAVTGRDDSREALRRLEQANLFVVPLDESREWYRYHRLFADLLRHRLQLRSGADAATLHRRASRWYADHGLVDDAIHHALAGADTEAAAALIEKASSALLAHGEVVTLLGWLGRLPEAMVRARAGLANDYSWSLILTGQLDAAESWLQRAEPQATGDPALLAGMLSARAYIARSRGDDALTIDLSRQALALLPQDAPALRGVVCTNLGIALWHGGALDEADQVLADAVEASARAGNQHSQVTALSFLAVIEGTRGKLRRAGQRLRQVLDLASGSPAAALAHDHWGALLYEWNDLTGAAQHLEQGVALSGRSGNIETLCGGYRSLARVRQAQGDAEGAYRALAEADRLIREGDMPPSSAARVAACHVQIALGQGDLGAAAIWADQVDEDVDAWLFFPRLGLTRARLLLAQGERAAAAELLAPQYRRAVEAGWRYGALEVRALQALAAPDAASGQAFLAEALTLAQPEGYVRTFVDKGEPLASLLRGAAAEGAAPDYAQQLLAALARESEPSPGLRPPFPPAPALIEPLTEREIEVLRLLADGLTNQEIANALFLSVNTIKTHLKNVYGKLDAPGRRAAVARARTLRLLP